MIEIKKDSKSAMWTIITTDREGFHRLLPVSAEDMDELTAQWQKNKDASLSP